jgi:ribonucleotide monophosphatase NagD (HAD superfamily)
MLGVEPARVLAVGDALRTDIAGATATGLASCWVLGGIHGEALNGDRSAARDAAARAGFAPVAAIPAFAWQA